MRWLNVRNYWLSVEVLGELLLLAVAGALFGYLFVLSFDWPEAAKLLPRIAVIIGVPFGIIRFVAVIRRIKSTPASVMDTAFRIEAQDPREITGRFVRIWVWVLALYLAIWMFGFHLALPVGIFVYLFRYGNAGWVWSLLLSLMVYAAIKLVYDTALHADWFDAVVPRWLGLV